MKFLLLLFTPVFNHAHEGMEQNGMPEGFLLHSLMTGAQKGIGYSTDRTGVISSTCSLRYQLKDKKNIRF